MQICIDGIIRDATSDEEAEITTFQSEFIAAEASYVPSQVTMAQARVALFRAGKLTAVQNAVTTAGGETEIWWDYSTIVERTNPLVSQIGTAIGLSSSDIDNLFRVAITI